MQIGDGSNFHRNKEHQRETFGRQDEIPPEVREQFLLQDRARCRRNACQRNGNAVIRNVQRRRRRCRGLKVTTQIPGWSRDCASNVFAESLPARKTPPRMSSQRKKVGIIPYEKVANLFFVASLFFNDLHVKEEAVMMEFKRVSENEDGTEQGDATRRGRILGAKRYFEEILEANGMRVRREDGKMRSWNMQPQELFLRLHVQQPREGHYQ